MMNNFLYYFPFLISLGDKDKKILAALLILFIVFFVIVAYIGNGIKKLMQKYADGIDEYMYPLGKAKLITNPKEFAREVRRKETKRLYFSTRWVLRVFILVGVGFILYASFANPSGEESLFFFTKEHLDNIKIIFETPRGDFFFFKNFPLDFPKIVRGPQPVFSIESIMTYLMLIVSIVTVFGVSKSTLRFMARVSKASSKGKKAFIKKIEDGVFVDND